MGSSNVQISRGAFKEAHKIPWLLQAEERQNQTMLLLPCLIPKILVPDPLRNMSEVTVTRLDSIPWLAADLLQLQFHLGLPFYLPFDAGGVISTKCTQLRLEGIFFFQIKLIALPIIHDILLCVISLSSTFQLHCYYGATRAKTIAIVTASVRSGNIAGGRFRRANRNNECSYSYPEPKRGQSYYPC